MRWEKHHQPCGPLNVYNKRTCIPVTVSFYDTNEKGPKPGQVKDKVTAATDWHSDRGLWSSQVSRHWHNSPSPSHSDSVSDWLTTELTFDSDTHTSVFTCSHSTILPVYTRVYGHYVYSQTTPLQTRSVTLCTVHGLQTTLTPQTTLPQYMVYTTTVQDIVLNSQQICWPCTVQATGYTDYTVQQFHSQISS